MERYANTYVNKTTNSSDMQCEPDPVAHLVTTMYLVTLHTLTLLVFLVVDKMVYDMIEITHPVFALAFQEVIVMTACKSIELACLMALAVTGSDLPFMLYTFVPVIALSFHQVTWLSITGLRFYLLLILKPDQDVDMDRLRYLCISLVWGIELILIPLCQLPWYLTAKDHGWPERRIMDILVSSYDDDVVLKTITVTVLISNLPDYFSIIIYAAMMWHHINHKNTIEPITEEEFEEEQFGGIWVGETLDDGAVQPGAEISTERNTTPPLPPNSTLQGNIQQAGHAGLDGNDNSDTEHCHKWQCVMPVLRWHVALSLFDVASTAINVFYCQGELGKMLIYLVQMLCCYWIPLVMITKNYKQMGSIWQYVQSKWC